MRKNPRQSPKISDSEWLVMQALWAQSPATTREIVERLEPHKTWSPKTVMTLIARLVSKGAVGYDKQGRAHHYYPLVDEATCVRVESRSFLDRVHGGALKPMLAHFLEHEKLSAAEIEELKAMLDERKR